MIFIDTGYFLALVPPRDSLQPRAQAWALAFLAPLVVTEFVWCEREDSLSMPVDRPKALALVGG